MGFGIPDAEKLSFCLDHSRRRQHHQCGRKQEDLLEEERKQHTNPSRMVSAFVLILLFLSSICRAGSVNLGNTSQVFRPGDMSKNMKLIRAHLKKINKPAVKTIQSPDGDIIDCVLAHKQPAFDHPKLRGQRPLEEVERPNGYPSRRGPNKFRENFQLWSVSNECPKGTIPIRRTLEKEVARASSVRMFGRKLISSDAQSVGDGHEHAVGYVGGDEDYYYGAQAIINVWGPQVENSNEFSLSQLWVIAGSFGDDLNTIEAGWQVSPGLYGDNYTRFFTYWTSNAYQSTGCYNLLCSGFVQTNNKIAIGAAISPTSSYSGGQYDIKLLIWKDPKHGNWWLEFGEKNIVGYWPSFLFTHLQDHASMVQFGGEIVNTQSSGSHTTTAMGSGHFPDEGFGKASYIRNIQVVDSDNSLVPPNSLLVLADHPNCYNVIGGSNSVWGKYIYYGGPGNNSYCL